jgi:hypothetical protein
MKRASLSLSLLLVACSSNSTPSQGVLADSGAQGSPCVFTTDCEDGLLCGYPIAAGCSAQGVCVAEDRTCLTDGPFVCGCDGSAVGLACIWGPGYAVVPVVNGTPGCTPDLDATID